MRKIAAILLLLLLSFNWYGYRFVISMLNKNADTKLEARIDNRDYDESQLIEIMVALNMPYQERFTEFERHYGQIEIDGKSYTYVKRKIEGDIVTFKCIANDAKQQLKAIDNVLTRANSGINTDQPSKQQQPPSFTKNFWSEYDGQNVPDLQNKYIALITAHNTNYSFHIPEVNGNTPHQPPEC